MNPLSSAVKRTNTKLSFPPISLNASYFTNMNDESKKPDEVEGGAQNG